MYPRYVEQFPKPVEAAVETHFKIAEIYQRKSDTTRYHRSLEADRRRSMRRPARAHGAHALPRGAGSALVLAQQVYESFATLKLAQPFEQSLEEKQRRMNAATAAFGQLVDYQVGEITAAATYYLGEIYCDFSRALRESERPAGLERREAAGLRGRARRRGVPVRGEGDQGAREESRADERRSPVQQLDREEPRAPRPADAGRYAKAEISSGFLGSIDRTPNARRAAAAAAAAAAAR